MGYVRSTAKTPRSRRRAAGRVAAWSCGAVIALFVAGGAWIAVTGVLAAGHVRAAQSAVTDVSLELADPTAATATLDRVGTETSAARALTSGPVWAAAGALPWVGPQLSAVTTTIAALDDVVTSGLRPLVDVAGGLSLSAMRPRDGAFDLSVFSRVQAAAAQSAGRVDRAAGAVDAIDTSILLPPLKAPVAAAGDVLDKARSSVDGLARATALLQPLLGADGPRDYLVVFQNNSEWRSLGGIVGAMAVLHTDAGRITLGKQESSAAFRTKDQLVTPLAPDLVQVFTERPGLYMQNVTQVPDFPTTGALARAMWAKETGQEVDGVISLDPVALSYVLEATGPVALPSGDTLTSQNAVPLLLNGVYLRYNNPVAQDAFFAAATVAIFNRLASGATDPEKLVAAFARATTERRLLVWSTHADEQAIVSGTPLAGPLPVTDAQRTTFGVYLNDGTGSKMDYYVHATAAAAWCRDTEGDPDALVTLRLRSDAPADAASLPGYITGGGAYGVAPGRRRRSPTSSSRRDRISCSPPRRARGSCRATAAASTRGTPCSSGRPF